MIQARKQLPCKQRFLSGMSFSIYESSSRGLSGLFSRSVYAPRDVNKPTTRLWSDANDFENAKSFFRKKPQNSLFNNLIFKKQIHTSCFWPKFNWTWGGWWLLSSCYSEWWFVRTRVKTRALYWKEKPENIDVSEDHDTKHASNSLVTFVTRKRLAVLFFLSSCCVNSLSEYEKAKIDARNGTWKEGRKVSSHFLPSFPWCTANSLNPSH